MASTPQVQVNLLVSYAVRCGPDEWKLLLSGLTALERQNGEEGQRARELKARMLDQRATQSDHILSTMQG